MRVLCMVVLLLICSAVSATAHGERGRHGQGNWRGALLESEEDMPYPLRRCIYKVVILDYYVPVVKEGLCPFRIEVNLETGAVRYPY